jgi:hypothetical protein
MSENRTEKSGSGQGGVLRRTHKHSSQEQWASFWSFSMGEKIHSTAKRDVETALAK